MRKALIAFAAVGAIMSIPALAFSAADKHFAIEAAYGGLAELEMGQIALQKAEAPQVKQFAQQMVTDHTQANNELIHIAMALKIELPAETDKKHQGELDRLKSLSGAAFDSFYMRSQVQDHQKAIAAFEKQANDGSDPSLKAFAQKHLPTLRQHLQMTEAAAPKN